MSLVAKNIVLGPDRRLAFTKQVQDLPIVKSTHVFFEIKNCVISYSFEFTREFTGALCFYVDHISQKSSNVSFSFE